MGRFLRTPLDVERAVTADGIVPLDLPVNPLSGIKVTLDYLDSAAATVVHVGPLRALQTITNIDIQFKGSSIINGSALDLAILSALLGNGMPQADFQLGNPTDRARVSFTIPFGRKLYWAREAFPATRRGELRILYTFDDILGTIDMQTVHTETIELIDAQPAQFLKYTTITRTPTATGDSDVDLPLGNPLVGALLFGTTVPTIAAITASMRRVRLLIDNVEQFYSDTRWASLHSDLMHRLPANINPADHTHTENLAAVYAPAVESGLNTFGLAANPNTSLRQYALLDFDPLTDDSYLLETEGRGRVHLRINADVADAQRIIPIELIRLPGGEA